MRFIRSLLFALLALLWTLLAGFTVTLFVIFPMRFRFAVIKAWRAVFMGVLCRYVLGLHYRVLGVENIPKTASVIMSKHQSAWETVALQSVFPPLVFVLKKSLLWIPFLGWAFAAIKMILIDRGASRKAILQVLTQGKERLNAGFWVLIFPEGTRIKPGEKGSYKSGGVHLAMKANVPIVPVAHNAGEFWAKNAFVKKAGIITVSIGAPIATDNQSADEILKQCETWIEEEMQKISQIKTIKNH